jgi:hypothetical protein
MREFFLAKGKKPHQVGAKSHFPPTKIETNCAYKTPSRTTTSPFLRANNSNHSRSIRKRFDSRKKRARSHPYRRFSTSENFSFSPRKGSQKKPKARAFVGFCVTYSERSQIRRRVLRPVLAETAREHVSRAMSETSASCSLVTHVCLCAFPVRFFGACEENFLCVSVLCCVKTLFWSEFCFFGRESVFKILSPSARPKFSRKQ